MQVFTSVVKSAMESIDKLRSRVNGGELCVGLGSQVCFFSSDVRSILSIVLDIG